MFLTKTEAKSWLSLRHAEIIRKAWQPPEAASQPVRQVKFADYAEQWMAERDVKARTREHYRKLLDQHLLPAFGTWPLASIRSDDVRKWHAAMGTATPTLRAHCYGLLRTIMGTAASDGKITVNPCVIRGAGTTKRQVHIEPATLDELETLTNEMPERYRAMFLLASWCALRFGELTALRRMDIDVGDEVIRIRRGVVRTNGGFTVTTPKSDAGSRNVAIPPHLIPAITDHLSKHVGAQPDSLLFPAESGGSADDSRG